MILIEQSFCTTNLRRVGLVYAFINIILTAGLIVLSKAIYDEVVEVAACFAVLYILLHLMLIYGLYWSKPTLLMWWLAFAPFEILILQAIVIYFDIFLIFVPYEQAWIGILMLLGHLVLTTFLFHNLCVVYSVRYKLINNQGGQNRDLIRSHAKNTDIVINSSKTPDTQYISLHG